MAANRIPIGFSIETKIRHFSRNLEVCARHTKTRISRESMLLKHVAGRFASQWHEGAVTAVFVKVCDCFSIENPIGTRFAANRVPIRFSIEKRLQTLKTQLYQHLRAIGLRNVPESASKA